MLILAIETYPNLYQLSMEEKKLFLLDAYALIYRAYYAMIRSPRITSKGFNTSAVFGFCNTLDEILRKEKPGYIAVCFDPPGGHTFRHEVYPEYKAQRDKQPEDITFSVPYIKRILEAYRIPVVEISGFEADDVIGSLARLAASEGFTTYMMTPDKDYGQLVDAHTFMYRPALKGQGFEIRGPKEVCERYGINNPSQVIDLLALEGDASDNVPGCPGVGEKTAAKLIAEWGSVENLLDNTDSLKGAMQKKISENAEQIRFSKFLVTIKTDVPLDITPSDLVRKKTDIDALAAIYDELEFKSFAARLKVAHGTDEAQQVRQNSETQTMGSLFDIDGQSDQDTITQPPIVILQGYGQISNRIAEALKFDNIGINLFAVGDDAMTANLKGMAFNFDDSATYYIQLPDAGINRAETLALIAPLFSSKTAEIVSDDIKRDILLLRGENIELTAKYFDTAVAHYIISPEMNHKVSTLAAAYLKYKALDFELTPVEVKAAYAASPDRNRMDACERAWLVRKLKPILLDEIDSRGQRFLLDEIELPFAAVLAAMEWEGVRIDVVELHSQSRKLTARVTDLEQRAYELAGAPFNIGSPMQVGEVLFGKLQIDPNAKKTKRGAWSTTEEVLEKYRKSHPIVELILEIRGLRKLLATYVDALPKLINTSTGKIHTTYNQTVTATGRISSTNPNLQNIPIRTPEGREIRRAFIPDRGDLMLSADYSQIELRLMAALSGDATMIEAFVNHSDIHRATASNIYHIDPDEVTDEQRRAAKTANFGIIYGISAFGLAERLAIPRSEAKALIDGYLSTYPGVADYMTDVVGQAKRDGFVSTIMGRKRFLPEINSRNAVVRGYAERNAINAPLQGSAADIIKIAMINIDREIRRRGLRSRMILQVHDELVFNVFPEEQDELKKLVVKLMEDAYSGRVPLEVGVGIGSNWLEAH